MTAVRTEFVQGTDEWLAARRQSIGSSDAPVIAGERGSIINLWAIKSGRLEPEPPDADTARLFEWGHRLEPVVAEWYSDFTGRPLRRVNRMLLHPTIPFLSASLDRVAKDRIVEIKTDRWGWKGDEKLPGAVKAQVQHQMYVSGYEVADIAVLTGGSEPEILTEERDNGYIDDLLYLEREFWGHVQDGTAPNADGSETTRRAIARMHPRDDGTWLEPTQIIRELAESLASARSLKKSSTADEATLANAIRLIVGDASGVAGILSLKKIADSTRTNWPAVAGAYRTLLEQMAADPLYLEEIEGIHTNPVDGPRHLRLLKEKE